MASGTHMDNNIFEDPNKIDPSRFDASSKTFPRFTYVPFGGEDQGRVDDKIQMDRNDA